MIDNHNSNQSKVWLFFCSCLLTFVFTTDLLAADLGTKELTALGNEAFERGEWQKADSLYTEALQKEADETALIYNRANVLYKQEKYDEAIALYSDAIKKGPPRKLLNGILFNAGNAHLKLAEKEAEAGKEEDLATLKKKLSSYEKSFDMYRQALETERALSIAEGRSVENAGLYARKNWALAREGWTAVWEKIRSLERKNMQLEDGVAALLQSQRALLPQLERIFLNSFTDDVLTFNLKRLAEYQRDYRADVLELKELAAKEVERLQTEIDNLKANQPAPPTGSPAPANQAPAPVDDTALQEQLKSATEIQKAIEQAVGLDEWIVDGLTRGKPLEVWNNMNQMIGLLEDLSSYLKGMDPALSVYNTLLAELSAAEVLIQQASQIAALEEPSTEAQTAGQKRLALFKTKSSAAQGALTKINFYLAKMKEQLASEVTKKADSTTNEEAASEEGKSLEAVWQAAFKKVAAHFIAEIERKNQLTISELNEISANLANKADQTLAKQQEDAAKSFMWYQQIQTPLEQALAKGIENLDTLQDQAASDNNADNHPPIHSLHLQKGLESNEMEAMLFQLNNFAEAMTALSAEQAQDSLKSSIKTLTTKLSRQTNGLTTAWSNYAALRSQDTESADSQLVPAADLLRGELLNTLLIFSPEHAIAISFARTKKLQELLTATLPASDEKISSLRTAYKASAQQAQTLRGILGSYFSGLEKSIADPNNLERQEAYSSSLAKKKKSIDLVGRFLEQGKEASDFLQKKRFQLSELLFNEMSNSIAKAHLAFQEQPDDAEMALNIAINFQKNLESQSRFASEALTTHGASSKINTFLKTSQGDIAEIATQGKTALEQTIGMASVPTHGQNPQASQPQPGQPDPAILKKVAEKISEAEQPIEVNKSFMEAGEFHNTFDKHQEIIAIFQEALDLLKNKDKEEGDDQKKEDEQGEKENKDQEEKQAGDSGQEQQNGQGENRPQKPLELSASEARQLLEQLNNEDEKEQGEKGVARKSFNTPRPW